MRCSICKNGEVETVERTGRILYQCPNGHTRPTVEKSEEGIKTTTFNGEKIQVKIAALVFTGEEILMVKRRKYPYLYSIPFRHLKENEKPSEAARKTVEKQTNLQISNTALLTEKVLPSRCWMRCNKHKWIFFKAEAEKNMVIPGKIADEANWFDRKKIIQDLPIDTGTKHLYKQGFLNKLTVI